MTAEEMLALLCERSPLQKTSLEAVYATCKEIANSGATNFSYAAIARLGAGRGVPKAQSISNKTGENYQALIKCFADAVGTRKRPSKPAASDVWADNISDAKLRILVHRTLAELTEAKRTIKELIPPGTHIRVDDRRQTSAAPPDFKLTDIERNAITHLMSDSFLKQWKLVRGERGDLLDENSRAVFMPGTLQALEKLLKYL